MMLFRTPSICERLDSDFGGTGDIAFSAFPLPDGPGITPHKHSEPGLREAELLAIGLEESGGHLPDPRGGSLHDDLLDGYIGSPTSGLSAVLSGIPCLPVGGGGFGNPGGLGSSFGLLGGLDLLPCPHGACGILSGHVHSPVVRWAEPVADEDGIGPLGRIGQQLFSGSDDFFRAGGEYEVHLSSDVVVCVFIAIVQSILNQDRNAIGEQG